MGKRIDFANAILKKQKTIIGKPIVYYSLRKYKKKVYYDILKEIGEHANLVQLIDYLGNVNRAISVVGYWIFDSNYKKALVLNKELLDMICAPSVGEEQGAVFEILFTSVRYI